MKIDWVSIKEVGMPKDESVGYLVSNGKDIEYSDIESSGVGQYKWVGGSVFPTYDGCHRTFFDFNPTHYSRIDLIDLP